MNRETVINIIFYFFVAIAYVFNVFLLAMIDVQKIHLLISSASVVAVFLVAAILWFIGEDITSNKLLFMIGTLAFILCLTLKFFDVKHLVYFLAELPFGLLAVFVEICDIEIEGRFPYYDRLPKREISENTNENSQSAMQVAHDDNNETISDNNDAEVGDNKTNEMADEPVENN